jgi:hypothetical protein
VTVNLQKSPVSLTTVTGVVPIGKNEPEAGVAVKVPQFPDPTAFGNVTIAPHWPASISTVILEGQLMVHDNGPVTVVTAVELLSDACGSSVELEIVAELEMVSPAARPPLTLNRNVNVALLLAGKLAIVHVPVLHVNVGPEFCVEEISARFVGAESVRTTFSATSGP